MRRLAVLTDTFVHPDVCGECGGVCCQQYPGAAFPEDFGKPEELGDNLLEALMTGRWTIDRKGDWYVRPNDNSHSPMGYFHTCTFWSKEHGCEIFETRPRGCRGLEPKKDRLGNLNCKVRYGSEDEARKAWVMYAELLANLSALLEDYE